MKNLSPVSNGNTNQAELGKRIENANGSVTESTEINMTKRQMEEALFISRMRDNQTECKEIFMDMYKILVKGEELQHQLETKNAERMIINNFLKAAKNVEWNSHSSDSGNDEYFHSATSIVQGVEFLLRENTRITKMLSKRLSRNNQKVKANEMVKVLICKS
jgi:hypothetical protein